MNKDAQSIISKINCVPNEYRRYFICAKDAYNQYSISESELDAFIKSGLSYKEVDGHYYFDSYDLTNLSLHLKKPSIQRMAMRSWGSILKKYTQQPALNINLSYHLDQSHSTETTVPPEKEVTVDSNNYVSGKDKDTSFIELMTYCSGMIRVEDTSDHSLWDSNILIKGQRPAFTSAQRELLREIDQLEFFMLPEGIRWDTEFIQEHAISECGGASKYLYQRACQQGLEARQVFGILLAAPYSTCHYWTELKVDDQWVGADPLLLKILRDTARLDPQHWTYDRSPDPIFLKLCEVSGYDDNAYPLLNRSSDEPYLVNPIASYNGQQVNVSLECKLISSDNNLQRCMAS